MTGFNSKREAAANKMQGPVDIASIIACRNMLDAQPVPAQEPVREALKLALITLEGWDNHDKWVWPETALEQAKRNTKEAITAIKEALAQPAQEPLAWMCSAFDGEPCEQTNHDECGNPIPLYTAPPQRPWVGLTEEDFSAINQSCLTKLQAATSAESILMERNS